MPRFDLLQHVVNVGCRKLMSGRVGDGAQFGIDGPRIIAPRRPKGLSDPFCDGQPLSAGNAFNL